MAVRLAGLVTFLLGIAVAYTDLVRDGGSPAVGAIISVMGAIDALLAPRLLKKMWKQQDG
jgi:uncharacterized protein YjeT (DUF2065 family)